MFARLLAIALAALLVIPLALGAPQVDAKKKKTQTITREFANTQTLDIITFQTRSSEIEVKGFKKGKLLDVDVVLDGFGHTLPDDVDIMIVAPNGRNAIVMSDSGAANSASNLKITLDDEAQDSLPDNDALSSGSFKPTNHDGLNDIFLMPDAPTPSGNVALSTFDGINPNGTWTLYVYDDNDGTNSGSLTDGWALKIKAKVQK